jgi:uncharacterized membrane protein
MTKTATPPLKHPISRRLRDERTFGERLADGVAHQIGSWRFLIIQTIAVAGWVLLNVIAVLRHWDPYPFVLLNLLFSVQAAYTGPVLLLSSNRAAQRDRIMAEHDYATNEKAEQLIEGILSELLRNSQATLAIAKHLDIQLDTLDEHSTSLEAKMEGVQRQLVEVDEVLSEDTARAHEAAVAEEHDAAQDTHGDLERESA